MNTFRRRRMGKGLTLGAATLLLAAMTMAGCAGAPPAKTAAVTAKPAGVWPLTIKDPAADESGAQIWAENCMRCHELRSPRQYTPAQWSVIVQYMRLKAGLTGEQARKVLAFLKSASAHQD